MGKEVFFILALLLILIPFISAPFGYDNPNLPNVEREVSFIKDTGDSVTGDYDFNGGWMNDGLTISGGDIFAQTGYFYNITSLNVTRQNLTVLDDLIVNGKVGIGTASPLQALDVRGNAMNFFTPAAQFRGVTIDPADGLQSIYTNWGGGGTETNLVLGTFTNRANQLYLQTDGDVGIGTNNPLTKLDVRGRIKSVATAPGAPGFIAYATDGTTINAQFGSWDADNGAFVVRDSSQVIQILLNGRVDRDSYIISGDFGLGITSPTSKLHVNGTVRAEEILVKDGNAGDLSISFINDGDTGIFRPTTNKLAFSTQGTERVRIDNTGLRIGAGNPEHALQIGNAFHFYEDISGDPIINSSDSAKTFSLSSARHLKLIAGNTRHIIFYDAGTENMRIDGATGYVGIGTSPSNPFHVAKDPGAATAIAFFDNTNADGYGVLIRSLSSASNKYTLKTLANGGAGVGISVMNDGNVGIGTATPTHNLNVVGNVNITGNLTLGDKITFAFNEMIDNLVDGWLTITGNLNVTGNVTAENVFLPSFIFVHDNRTTSLTGAGVWANITFDQEVSAIKKGVGHTFNDVTNYTFVINQAGIYDITYDFDAIDTSASSTDIDVAGRVIYVNGTEIHGSVFETDITKKDIETEISHTFLARFGVGDTIVFQFTAGDGDVQISTHGTFGDHTDSSTIEIKKVANL